MKKTIVISEKLIERMKIETGAIKIIKTISKYDTYVLKFEWNTPNNEKYIWQYELSDEDILSGVCLFSINDELDEQLPIYVLSNVVVNAIITKAKSCYREALMSDIIKKEIKRKNKREELSADKQEIVYPLFDHPLAETAVGDSTQILEPTHKHHEDETEDYIIYKIVRYPRSAKTLMSQILEKKYDDAMKFVNL